MQDYQATYDEQAKYEARRHAFERVAQGEMRVEATSHDDQQKYASDFFCGTLFEKKKRLLKFTQL